MTEQSPRDTSVTYYYPGLGLALRYDNQDDYGFYPIGAHGSCYGSISAPLPVRELAMMSIMENLTDKEDWHKKVFDDTIVARWRGEALAIPDEHLRKLAVGAKYQRYNQGHGQDQLDIRDDKVSGIEKLERIMTENVFKCCIDELRSKAEYFEKTGIVPTLDACASIAKSDKLVSPELHQALIDSFQKLKADQAFSPDWHPNSGDMVQDLVHPSLYPLVYGRSRVHKEEVVGVSDAIDQWAGKGNIIPKDDWKWEDDYDRYRYGVGSGTIPPNYWSDTFQWLPANVVFDKDGKVKFTSYVNNLHPNKYPDIYYVIEALIETSLPMWDQCLKMAVGYEKWEGAGRMDSRYPKPDYPDDNNPANWIPNDPKECADAEVDMEEFLDEFGFENDEFEEGDLLEYKWEQVRKPLIPEPHFKDVDYAPKEGKRLIDRFRQSGLQIIVKMASIELSPEKPEFPVGGWHVEGQMNEHICATALYYLDSENVTTSSLSFRMQTSAYLNDDKAYVVGQDSYHWMESFYGTSLGGGNSPCLQNYGTVETRQGRLLAFPNVFQHQVSSFKLIDPTKPGHRRFIALWLVDPTKRIISTANVPPQQMNWWADAVFGSLSDTEKRKEVASKLPPEIVALLQEKGLSSITTDEDTRLPQELMKMVREYLDADVDALPMSIEEAREHRKKLMQDRSAFHVTSEKWWQQHSYNFCEH